MPLVLSALGGLLGGCTIQGTTVRSVLARQELAQHTRAEDGCELRLYVENVSEGEQRLGAVELADGRVLDGVCIKRPGQPLDIPARILIAGHDMGDFGYVCEGDAAPLAGDDRQACVWNHVHRNKFPMTFTLIAARGKISDYVAVARVYRNGSLLARYNSASALACPSVLEFPGAALEVPDSPFSERPPHLATMDLRILPAGVTIDPGVLKEEIVDYRSRTRERLNNLGRATLDALDPKLGQQVSCELERLHAIEARVRSFAAPTVEPQGGACTALPGAPKFSVRDAYERLSAPTKVELDNVDAKLREELDKGRDWLERALADVRAQSGLPKAIDDKVQELAKLGADAANAKVAALKQTLDQQRAALGSLEDAIGDVERLMNETDALGQSMKSSIKRAFKDKQAQVQMYDAALASLEKSGTIFEPYTDNPATLAGERQLSMRHGDSFQWFALAPWNGAVFRVTGEVGTKIDEKNLIPILDLGGMRVQWGRTRFSEFRAALGILYFSDPRRQAGSEEVTEDFTFAGQANVSLGNIKIGAAIAPFRPQHSDATKAERVLRVLVGADVLKLLSGSNVEVF